MAGHALGRIAQLVEHALLIVESLRQILRKVADPDIMSDDSLAGGERIDSRESLIMVDFPEPFGPTSATRAPRSIARSTPSYTVSAP